MIGNRLEKLEVAHNLLAIIDHKRPSFPSSGGVAKIQRIFDGVVLYMTNTTMLHNSNPQQILPTYL
ncbi:MAG TPA: hypothetical protein DIT10_00040 [Chryseobacterium sp.]|nr:hypothetical protein [Chryseobacterium sp.]